MLNCKPLTLIFFFIYTYCLHASDIHETYHPFLEFVEIDFKKAALTPIITKEISFKHYIPKNEDDFKKNVFFPLSPNPKITAKNAVTMEIFGPIASQAMLQKIEKAYLESRIPALGIGIHDNFHLITSINNLKLSLPCSFFNYFSVENKSVMDTVLSEDGMNQLMCYYAHEKDIYTYVFMTNKDFEMYLPKLLAKAQEKPVAIILQLDQSKRHSSGIILKKNADMLESFIFDSVGIDLPAEYCGQRGYANQTYYNLNNIITVLKNQQVKIMISPINTVIQLQKDFYSCFFAAFMFFETILTDNFKRIDNNDTDYTEVYGIPYKYGAMGRYAISYLPFLAGVQDALALILMTDCLDNFNFLDLACAQANWNRIISKEEKKYVLNKDGFFEQVNYIKIEQKNLFWQIGYLKLLEWFNECNKNGLSQPLPDFTTLALEKGKERDESDMEQLVNKLMQSR